jgi:glycosyltransferase involved in cell wall biosynthesis
MAEQGPSIYVVIAAYEEARVIGEVVAGVTAFTPHVVVVDDGSEDDTRGSARRAGATVLRHPVNRGQGAALQSGISFALKRGADVIVTFDADGQHDVGDLPALVEPILSGRAEIALGSRFLGRAEGIPAARRAILALAVVFTRVTSGARITDAHNGLRAMSRRAAAKVDLQLDRMAHASEIIDQLKRTGLPYVEVPVSVRYTDYSLAKGQKNGNAVRVAIDYLLNKFPV